MSVFKGRIVNKPWGYEYLMYENDSIGLWYLYIKYGHRTSLHCHPRKKTGLVLLSGNATIRFLNDSLSLRAPGKMMIRAGLFHSTEARSRKGAVVMEVETPPHKRNLVRLEDRYDRVEKPYEGPKSMVPMRENCVQLDPPKRKKRFKCKVEGCLLMVEKIKDISILRKRPAKEIVVVLDGGLLTHTGQFILGPGDVVSVATVNRLAETFPASGDISLLIVTRARKGG